MCLGKSFAVHTVLILASFFVGLLIVEITIRLMKIAPPINFEYAGFVSDDTLPYYPKPLSVYSGRSASDEYNFVYEHNSYGFRDTEFKSLNKDKQFIIMGLGDSFTYGVGAEFEETYLYLLERSLNLRGKDHRNVRIIKAGIPRYFPETQRLLFEKYSAIIMPDLIIVGFLPNDIMDTYYGIDAILVDNNKGYLITREAETLDSVGSYFYSKSHIFRIIFRHYINSIQARGNPRFKEIFKDDGFHEKEWKKVENEYKKIIKIADGIGAKTLFIHIPQKGYRKENYSYISARFTRFVSENGAYFFDTLPHIIDASKNEKLYYEKDGHCTPEGYRVIAKSVFEYLTENELVP